MALHGERSRELIASWLQQRSSAHLRADPQRRSAPRGLGGADDLSRELRTRRVLPEQTAAACSLVAFQLPWSCLLLRCDRTMRAVAVRKRYTHSSQRRLPTEESVNNAHADRHPAVASAEACCTAVATTVQTRGTPRRQLKAPRRGQRQLGKEQHRKTMPEAAQRHRTLRMHAKTKTQK